MGCGAERKGQAVWEGAQGWEQDARFLPLALQLTHWGSSTRSLVSPSVMEMMMPGPSHSDTWLWRRFLLFPSLLLYPELQEGRAGCIQLSVWAPGSWHPPLRQVS